MAKNHEPEPGSPESAESGAAVDALCEALTLAGIVLPSLSPDLGSPNLALVNLGRVRADTAMRLAAAVRRGTDT
ncbi:hypothetical protein OEIGOIKO_07004 [Streptomyces chrestomyceticus JCM 4735]|uniref:Uncharacterized protein n=1 Tax=Streptomyces chrestomyceticus JCM 4735 TaxID=1306181 RepID=A0A7U9Q274_9ACTN|nr:hypothetical protein [Streptomyces chrestomyceticus]GCD39175.1 hypothetical protein OEIGOIKO_07004 [Streptomyces chrestomyceticus JCM 4735]